MKSTTIIEEITTLVINKKEKEWLKARMQNHKPSDDPEDIEMKRQFWVSLGGSVVRNGSNNG